jgi:diguanylate cyclase (GGDEF)-like protein
MLKGGEGVLADLQGDRRLAPAESGLIDTLTRNIRRILTAASAITVLPEAMPQIAQLVAIDRLLVTERSPLPGGAPTVLFRWAAPGLPPARAGCHGLAQAGAAAAWDEVSLALDAGATVTLTRVGASEAMRSVLSQAGLDGLMMVPVMLEDRHWGQIGFESEARDSSWSGEEVAILECLGAALASALSRERHQERVAQLARTDALTGVANRITFTERLRQAFAASQRGAHPFAVLYLDLDRFKEINDSLGHHAGDLLLQQVAQRLQSATRQIDLVARLGGDEFAIVQAELMESASAGALADKLIEIISAPYSIEGNELRLGVSIGISTYSGEIRTPDVLLAQADQALYLAKRAGRGRYRFYSEQLERETRAQLALAEELRAALARAELEVYYQPQVELASGRIVGMEALLRWNHPQRGVLLPEDFLPIAEKFGLMQQLGRWVLQQACTQMALWRAQGLPVPVIAINVALAQIRMGAEFVHDVMDSIARAALEPGDIELDVTERVLARAKLAQSGALEELRRQGIAIAIDDFGAQYSSLDYLRSYRVSRLKIARGMIAAADAEPGGSAMIRAILSLARELGVEVVAEGVETESQRRLLVEASSQVQGQGFYYSRAVSAQESLRLLREGKVGRQEPDPVPPHSP